MRGFLFFWVVVLCLLPGGVEAVPGVVNYSGRLVDGGGVPVSGDVEVEFSFWDSAVGGVQLGDGYVYGVVVSPGAEGLYSVGIGDSLLGGGPVPAGVFDGDGVWLNVRVEGEDLVPRARMSSVGFAFRAGEAGGLSGPAHVTVVSSGTAVQNGLALLEGYERARGLRPNGVERSVDNRVVVLVSPGRYDLGQESLVLDEEFIDLVGLSTARDNQFVIGKPRFQHGVLHQMANDVRIENLRVECALGGSSAPPNGLIPAAYFPEDTFTTFTVLRNCEFIGSGAGWSTRTSGSFEGTYVDCVGGVASFGGGDGVISGTFIDCVGGDKSFSGSVVSGVFRNCVAGLAAFGGVNARITGSFFNCRAGEKSFGYNRCVVSGEFVNCRAGRFSFGGTDCTVSGTFENCVAGDRSFGGVVAQVSGLFRNCVAEELSFGGMGGTVSGARFWYCVAGPDSFDGVAAERFFCVMDGVVLP